MRWGVFVIGVILSMPLASASSVGGVFEVSGNIALPPHARTTSAPLVLFIPTAATGTITGHAPSVSIQVFEYRYVGANAIIVKPSLALPSNGNPTWIVHEVSFEVDPARPGWVGIRPHAADLNESNSLPARLTNEAGAQIGNGLSGGDSRKDAGFLVPLEGQALTRSADAWTLRGGVSMKLYGPTVTITSRENATTIETGEWSDPNAPGQIVRRWVILETEEATVSAEGTVTRIASREARVTFDGTAILENATGALRDPFEEWRADGSETRIDGAFVMTVAPTAEAGRTTLHVTGDLRGSTMNSRIALPPAPSVGLGVGIILVLGLVLGSVGSAYYVHKKMRKRGASDRERPDAESLAALAERAADAGDYADAAALLDEARRGIPTSRRLALDHAFFVSQAGDAKRALRFLDDPLIRDDPDALILGTRIHTQAGDLSMAEASLTRALDAAPLLVLDIEGDPAYEPLLHRDRVRTAMRRARRRIH